MLSLPETFRWSVGDAKLGEGWRPVRWGHTHASWWSFRFGGLGVGMEAFYRPKPNDHPRAWVITGGLGWVGVGGWGRWVGGGGGVGVGKQTKKSTAQPWRDPNWLTALVPEKPQ